MGYHFGNKLVQKDSLENYSISISRVIFYLVILFLFGIAFIWITANNARKDLYSDLSRHARIAASTINTNLLQSLDGNISDTSKLEYHKIKNQFNKIVHVIPDARFVYLLGQKNTDIFFFTDSETVGSEDESLPGDIYSEASATLKSTFTKGLENFEGPLSDKWGNWISVFIPITNSSGEKVIAVLGLDISSNKWNNQIIKECLLPVSLMIFVLYFFFTTILIRQKIKFNKIQTEKIRMSEEKYRLLLTNIKDIVYSIEELSNEFIYLSPSFERITGYNSEDIKNMGGRLAFLSKVARVEKDFDSENPRLLSNDDKFNAEYRQEAWWKCKNGKFKYLQDHWIPIYSDNKIVSRDGILIDITERKLAEERLFESENFQRLLLESIDVGIIIIDPLSKTIESTNKFAESLIGNTSENIIGKKCSQIICSQNSNDCSDIDNGIETDNSESKLFRSDKSEIPILKTIRKIKVNNQNKILVSFVDLTSLKETEKALKESSNKWEAIIAASPDGIGMISLDSKIILISDKLVEMYGFTIDQKNELIGRNIYDFIDPSNHTQLKENFTKILIGEKNNKISEYLCLKNNGEKFYAEVNSKVLYNSNNVPSSIIFVERDITEKRKIDLEIQLKNEELIKANIDKDRFLSILAHDLKSPFNGLLGFSDLLSLNIRNYDQEKIEKYAGIINKTARSTFNLLEDLLLWARSQSGKIPFEPQITSFSKICQNVVDGLKLNANNKDISITYPMDNEILVYSDIDMLKTILRNLVSNAIKFTKNSGNIEITAEHTENNMLISVSDDGIGISEKSIKKLFDVTSNYSTIGTDKESGTGLGLLLCKEFVEKHGGTITVKSEHGKGSSFSFTLPHLSSVTYL